MTQEAKRRGRPAQAAQSLDEALARLAAGELPKRPRNEHERVVFGGSRGRKADPASKSAQAGQVAAYLVLHDGLSLAEAARRAGNAFNVHPDTVRRYARKLRAEKIVTVQRTERTWAGIVQQVAEIPLVHSIADSSQLPD